MRAGEQMRRRIELLSEVVFETNAAGQLVFLERGWRELVGKTPAECLGHPLSDCARVRRDDGAMKCAETSLVPMAGGGAVRAVRDVRICNAELLIVSVLRDASEPNGTQQQLEDVRSRAEAANEAKIRFLATISHEMRTPLNAILGSMDLALPSSDVPAGPHPHWRASTTAVASSCG